MDYTLLSPWKSMQYSNVGATCTSIDDILLFSNKSNNINRNWCTIYMGPSIFYWNVPSRLVNNYSRKV